MPPVPGMLSESDEKWAFKWALLRLCQSIHILSTNPWWRKNSGEVAESKEHIKPPIKQCTLSWKLMRKEASKEPKRDASVLNNSTNAIASGGFPTKRRVKHPPPADGTTFQVPCLKGPVVTHCVGRVPFPPNPLLPLNQRSEGRPRQGVCDTIDQSQYATVNVQSMRRSRFSYSRTNHLCQGRKWSAPWIPVVNMFLWSVKSRSYAVLYLASVEAVRTVLMYLSRCAVVIEVNSRLTRVQSTSPPPEHLHRWPHRSVAVVPSTQPAGRTWILLTLLTVFPTKLWIVREWYLQCINNWISAIKL